MINKDFIKEDKEFLETIYKNKTNLSLHIINEETSTLCYYQNNINKPKEDKIKSLIIFIKNNFSFIDNIIIDSNCFNELFLQSFSNITINIFNNNFNYENDNLILNNYIDNIKYYNEKYNNWYILTNNNIDINITKYPNLKIIDLNDEFNETVQKVIIFNEVNTFNKSNN